MRKPARDPFSKPAHTVSQDVRCAWRALSDEQLVTQLKAATPGCEIVVCNRKNRHIKIIGPSRPVELYATTGTVNAGRFGDANPYKAVGMQPPRAFERAASLAIHGY